MDSLREFIATRREEVKRQIAALKVELRELNLAEAAIKTGMPEVQSSSILNSGRSKPTIKDMVLAVLSNRPTGAEASEIVDLIENEFGEQIARSSLSPQLSRLKEEGLIELAGRIWKVTSEKDQGEAPWSSNHGGGEVREQALPTARAEGASPSTSTHYHPSPEETDDDSPI